MMNTPFEGSWWVVPGQLLAGRYPGDVDSERAEMKLGGLLNAGIETVICLQEEDERGSNGQLFVPYVGKLTELAELLGVDVKCSRFPIVDGRVPDVETMGTVLDALDASLDEGKSVYVHCWCGHGRCIGGNVVRKVQRGQRGERPGDVEQFRIGVDVGG